MRKAIISRSLEDFAPKITLLGHGESEQAARRAAFQNTHRGQTPYGDEFDGGELVDMDPELVEALESNSPHWAMESLFLQGQVLRAMNYTPSSSEIHRILLSRPTKSKQSEAHDRRSKAVMAIGATQAKAVTVAIADSDRGTLLDIASTALTLEPLRLIFEHLQNAEDAELRTLALARWTNPCPYASREHFHPAEAVGVPTADELPHDAPSH